MLLLHSTCKKIIDLLSLNVFTVWIMNETKQTASMATQDFFRSLFIKNAHEPITEKKVTFFSFLFDLFFFLIVPMAPKGSKKQESSSSTIADEKQQQLKSRFFSESNKIYVKNNEHPYFFLLKRI